MAFVKVPVCWRSVRGLCTVLALGAINSDNINIEYNFFSGNALAVGG